MYPVQDGNLTNAERREHEPVTPRVLHDGLVCVDDEQRGISAARASDHVLQELAVPWRVEDDAVSAGVLKKTRAASIVMPYACSSLSASSRNAFSNRFACRSHVQRPASSFPSGSEPVSSSRRPTTVLFPWSTCPVTTSGTRSSDWPPGGLRRRNVTGEPFRPPNHRFTSDNRAAPPAAGRVLVGMGRTGASPAFGCSSQTRVLVMKRPSGVWAFRRCFASNRPR